MKRLFSNFSHNLKIQNVWLENFFYGNFYPVIVGLVALISYVSAFPYFALTVFVFFACILLLLYKDLTPFLILPMTVVIIFKDFSSALHPYCMMLYCFVAVCLITHFIIYPVRRIRGKLFLPLLAVTCTLFLGGVGSSFMHKYTLGLVTSFFTGPFLLIAYLLFSAYVNPPENFDLKSYFSYVLTVLAVIISIEVFLHNYISFLTPPGSLLSDIGWSNINGVAVLLLLSIPLCWYRIIESNHPNLYFIALAFIYVGLIFTQSDGCIGIAILFAPLLAGFSLTRTKGIKRKKLAVKYCAILLIATIGALVTVLYTNGKIVEYLLQVLFSDHGRLKFYEEALRLFSSFPVFGIGHTFSNPATGIVTDGLHSYTFHSTLFHVLATMGVVGFVAYIFYFIVRFRILGAKNTTFNLFAMLGFIMYEIYGMIDASEFTIMPQMFILTILILIVEKTNNRNYKKTNFPISIDNDGFPLSQF